MFSIGGWEFIAHGIDITSFIPWKTLTITARSGYKCFAAVAVVASAA